MTDRTKSSYSQWAHWYDFIFPVKQEQISFVEENIGGGKFLMDVGCGTGNLLIALSNKERELTGVDVDPEMVGLARQKSHEQNLSIRWEIKSMTDLPTLFAPNSFDTIICFGNTLVHASSINDAEQVLKDIFPLLSPDGTLLLQIVNYQRIFFYQISELPVIEDRNIKFCRTYEFPQAETVLFNTTLKIKKTGEEIGSSTPLIPLTSENISRMIRAAGFRSMSIFGDFKQTSFSPNESPALVLTAKK